jgi:hypothetical protein
VRSKSYIALSALILRYCPSERKELLSLAPTSDVDASWVEADAADAFNTSISARLSQVHYSWLAKLIRGQPEELHPYWVGCLPAELAERTASLLHIEAKESPSLLRQFVQQQLYLALECEEVLPAPLLPPSPLNRLLSLDKKGLVDFISLLGIRDLAMRLRQVVARETIVHFQKLLSGPRYRYLMASMRLQDPFPPPHWDLTGWRGTARELERLLQERGLMRLGAALKDENSSLIWHLVRKLDTGRGERLQAESGSVWEKAIRRAANRQVVELLESPQA